MQQHKKSSCTGQEALKQRDKLSTLLFSLLCKNNPLALRETCDSHRVIIGLVLDYLHIHGIVDDLTFSAAQKQALLAFCSGV